jgi:SAM-dependent methyltransferase
MRLVPQLPRALRWDHNAHYHRWLLRQLPAGPGRVLDAGCGTGVLAARLAERAGRVDAVDLSPAMIARARALHPPRSQAPHSQAPHSQAPHLQAPQPQASGVRWLTGDLLDPGLPLDPDGYDVVTALSSLHHLPLRPGLARLAGLLRPGGLLLVVGLYRIETPADYAFEAVRQPVNAMVGVIKAVRGRAGKPHDTGMPVRRAEASWREITAAARELLPGARLHRRFFWRYSLLWRRPMSDQKAGELPVTPV